MTRRSPPARSPRSTGSDSQTAPVERYLDLMARFLDGSLPVHRFERDFLTAFKDETDPLPDDVFPILDTLFADVDAFYPGPGERLADELDEAGLRERVRAAHAALARLMPQSAATQGSLPT
jgi:hypothetical protein